MTNLPTRLKVRENDSQIVGGAMMEGPITYEPLKGLYITLGFLIILVQAIGLVIGSWFDYSSIDISLLLLVSVAVPLLISALSFYFSWKLKRSNISYVHVDWQFEPIQLKLEDAKKLVPDYRKKFGRLVAVPYIWYYYLPIFLIIFLFTFPLYTAWIDPFLLWVNPIVYLLFVNLVLFVSFWGGWRSTSTAASKDFTLPQIREVTKLATTQSKVEGVSHVRVVLDRAESDGYEIYRDPRVVIRIEGIEQDSYIESWTEEFGSVDRMMVRILKTDSKPEVVWWWQNRDRWFRKYIGDETEGYYVKNPVPSKVQELGVKDVKLVTQNGIAILILEWQKVREPVEHLSSILHTLGVNTNH